MARRRYQHPKVHATKAKRPQWHFRARIDVLTDSRLTERKEKIYYLGFCDEIGKREAEKLRDAILSEAINRPQLIIQSQVKFKEVIAAYRRTHIPTLKEISAREYLHVIEKWIEPHFGNKRMCEIGIEDVQRWISSIDLSWRSKKQCLLHFSMIWTKARQWGYTQTMTPAEGVSVGAQRDVFEHRILTLEEFQRLSAALDEPYRLMAHVALFTGMRVSEIRGLIWKSIDFQTGSIWIDRRKDAMDVIDVPKSRRSRRALPLGHLKAELAARKPAGATGDDLVFPGVGRYDECQVKLRKAAEAIGVDFHGFGWHTFRRMNNTYFRKDGNDVLAMQQQGHGSRAANDIYLVVEQEDFRRREEIVKRMQERFMGIPAQGQSGPVN